MSEYSLDFDSLEISPEAIILEMGYNKIRPEKEVSDILYSIFENVAAITQPSCAFCLLGGETNVSSVIIKTTTLNVGSVIANLLKGSDCFAVFAATIGAGFQEYQEKVKKEGDMLSDFILDTIGSHIVEKVGDKMELLLEKQIIGYSHTHRFSPGYCGWPLKDQKEIFHILGDQPCDILLSDVFLMHPIKSISGIIGIGENIREKKYGCDICQLETCYKRKYKKKRI